MKKKLKKQKNKHKQVDIEVKLQLKVHNIQDLMKENLNNNNMINNKRREINLHNNNPVDFNWMRRISLHCEHIYKIIQYIIIIHSLFISDYTSLNLLETGNLNVTSDLLCLNNYDLVDVAGLKTSSITKFPLLTVYGLIG